VEYLKVLEKSQSVQDLMVFTADDASDFGDLDSLPHMGLGDSFAISSKEVVLPPPPKTSENKDEPENNASSIGLTGKVPNNAPASFSSSTTSSRTGITNISQPNLSNHSNASSIGLTEKNPQTKPASFNSSSTSSRTGITSISQPNLSNTDNSLPTESEAVEEQKSRQNPNSSPAEVTSNGNNQPNPLTFLNVPELSLLLPTPGTTPNRTGIDINVMQPNPSPGPCSASNNEVLLAMDGNNPAAPSTPTNEDPAAKKKLKFVFSPVRACNGNENPYLRRNTSTPKSATSPLPRDELMNITNNGDDGDVFDNDSSFGNGDTTEINTSGPISPIKKLRGISSGEL
jgi:hypothetical protein